MAEVQLAQVQAMSFGALFCKYKMWAGKKHHIGLRSLAPVTYKSIRSGWRGPGFGEVDDMRPNLETEDLRLPRAAAQDGSIEVVRRLPDRVLLPLPHPSTPRCLLCCLVLFGGDPRRRLLVGGSRRPLLWPIY